MNLNENISVLVDVNGKNEGTVLRKKEKKKTIQYGLQGY